MALGIGSAVGVREGGYVAGGGLAGAEGVGEVEGSLALAGGVVEDGAEEGTLLEGVEGGGRGVYADDRHELAALEVAGGLEGLDGAEGHVVVVGEHDLDLALIGGEPGGHLLLGLRAVPHGGVLGKLLSLDPGGLDGLDRELGAVLGVGVGGVADQHDVLEHAVLIEVGLGVGLPVVGDDLAFHGAGLLGFGADVVGLVVLGHVGGGGLAVEEDEGKLLLGGLADEDGDDGGINGVDREGGDALADELVDLIVFLGLVVLAVLYGNVDLVLGRGLDPVADIGHEGVVELVDANADAGLAGLLGRAGGEREHDGEREEQDKSLLH